MSSSNIVLDLNPNSKTFGYKDLDVTVSTNYEAGYTLSMSTADNSTDLKRDASLDSINASINTLGSSYTDANFSNCLDTDTNCMNRWGYKNGLSSNYFPFVSGATILENTAATNRDNTTLRFAAKIDYNQPSGTYNNELIFTATANPIVYDIKYYDLLGISSSTPNDSGITWNNPTSGTAKEASYTVVATQASSTNTGSIIVLNPQYTAGSAPTRHTYSFAGWCLGDVNNTIVATQNSSNKVTAYNNPSTVCNGTIYQAGDNIQLDPSITNNINLYAVWTPTSFADAGVAAGSYMQDIGTSCANVTPNQFTTMVDARGNGNDTSTYISYAIIKLMDGNCWMADNLDLDVYAYKSNLSTSNTHAHSTSLNYFINGGNTSTTNRYPTGAINSSLSSAYTDSSPVSHSTQDWSSSYSYTVPLANRHGSCSGSATGSYPCAGVYETASYTHTKVIDYLDGVTTKPYTYGVGSYKIGTYYNYCAASAGYYCYDSSSGTGDSAYDICPAGWKLPLGTQAVGSYYYLNQQINKITTTPNGATDLLSLQTMLSTPVSGNYRSGTAYWQGTYGLFWSSTFYSTSNMYCMRVSGTAVGPQNSSSRYDGYSVRCIAQ